MKAAEELGEAAVSLTSKRKKNSLFVNLGMDQASCARQEGISHRSVTRGRAVYTGHAAPAAAEHPPQWEAAGDEQQKEIFFPQA